MKTISKIASTLIAAGLPVTAADIHAQTAICDVALVRGGYAQTP
jgi:hypothetical protein